MTHGISTFFVLRKRKLGTGKALTIKSQFSSLSVFGVY
jgi:hypothetical protein